VVLGYEWDGGEGVEDGSEQGRGGGERAEGSGENCLLFPVGEDVDAGWGCYQLGRCVVVVIIVVVRG